MRVATFNLWSGRSLAEPGAVADEDRLRTSIVDLAAVGLDVLAVQEVDRDQARSGGVDQLAVVASAFGAVDARFAPTLVGVPGPGRGWQPVTGGLDDAVPAGPAYGIGVVSRLPVLAWRIRRLAGSRAVLPVPVPRPGRAPSIIWVPDEPRAALAAVLATDSGPVTVICTHLSFSPPTAIRQLHALRRWSASLPGPRILAGDLNLPGGLPGRLTGWRSLAQAPTFPSASPRFQLDHLLTDGPRGVGGTAHLLGISDHRALAGSLPHV